MYLSLFSLPFEISALDVNSTSFTEAGITIVYLVDIDYNYIGEWGVCGEVYVNKTFFTRKIVPMVNIHQKACAFRCQEFADCRKAWLLL